MKPQRYYINELPNGGFQILADDSGEWVKWDDIKALMRELSEARERLAGHERSAEGINEALNMGDGSYHP